jgi:hypothetical protein
MGQIPFAASLVRKVKTERIAFSPPQPHPIVSGGALPRVHPVETRQNEFRTPVTFPPKFRLTL